MTANRIFVGVALLLCLSLSVNLSSGRASRVKRSINWNGNNWALGCDWWNNDMWRESTTGEQCGGKCAATSGCTHFTWTNYLGGSCWLKSGAVSPSDAFQVSEPSAVCGYMQSSGGGGISGSGKTTRYWDCCKPSCSWAGKADVTSPVQSCAANGLTVLGVNDQSGCGGGSAYTCNSQQPFSIGSTGYGFAAAVITGKSERDLCCACFELTFTSGPVNGQKMIVQVTNTGSDLGENHFDLQIPGGGVGIYNGCKPQWGAPDEGWGNRYGGVWSRDQCNNLPWQLQDGCRFRFDWFKSADNPTMNFKSVSCPSELTSKSGCARR